MTDLTWVYDNMLQYAYPVYIAELFPYPITNKDGLLYPVRDWTLGDYRQRLQASRNNIRDVFLPMTIESFRAFIRKEEANRVYEMTPESVVRHLAQHESEHRGEIQLFISAYREN